MYHIILGDALIFLSIYMDFLKFMLSIIFVYWQYTFYIFKYGIIIINRKLSQTKFVYLSFNYIISFERRLYIKY